MRECALRACTVIRPRTPRVAELLIEGLSDEDEEVRAVAAMLLRMGFDQYFGFRPDDAAGGREKALWKWRTWYRLNKDRLRWDEKRGVFGMPEKAGEPAAE